MCSVCYLDAQRTFRMGRSVLDANYEGTVSLPPRLPMNAIVSY